MPTRLGQQREPPVPGMVPEWQLTRTGPDLQENVSGARAPSGWAAKHALPRCPRLYTEGEEPAPAGPQYRTTITYVVHRLLPTLSR
jgi:hypothetical protein